MGYPPMIGNEHFHRGYSLMPQKSKSLISYGIIRQAVWDCLVDFKKACGGESAPSLLDGILITIQRFRHDIDLAESDNGSDRNELAAHILFACLGGLDSFFEDMRLT